MSRALHLILALAVACVACGPAPPSRHVAPDPSESPPTTSDPGSVEDMPIAPPKASFSPKVEPPSNVAQPASGKPEGSTCLLAAECASGVCEGQGCDNDHPGTCASEQRGCTRDRREYCGCDHKTFASSGSCPGRRFATRTKCTP